MKKYVGMMGVVLSLALIAFADPVDKIEPSADPNLDITLIRYVMESEAS